jgi:hypothetical protein
VLLSETNTTTRRAKTAASQGTSLMKTVGDVLVMLVLVLPGLLFRRNAMIN